MPDASLAVLMPVYNAAEFLPAAIESILGQTCRDFRFVIVDDGSTDASPSIIRRYAGADDRIVSLTKPNSGTTATLNHGLAAIDTTYIARMDADDIALPHRLQSQLDVMVARSDLAALGGRVHCIDRQGRRRRMRPVVTGPQAVAAALPFRNAINHPSVMLRRAAVAEVGGYREKFRFSQDYDLWLRLSECYALDNIDETLLLYRTYSGRSSSSQNRQRQTATSVAAAADFFARRYGVATTEAPVDAGDASATVAVLRALFAADLADSDRRALYRHSLRLIRSSPRAGTSGFSRFMLAELMKHRSYQPMAKLFAYSIVRRLRS